MTVLAKAGSRVRQLLRLSMAGGLQKGKANARGSAALVDMARVAELSLPPSHLHGDTDVSVKARCEHWSKWLLL